MGPLVPTREGTHVCSSLGKEVFALFWMTTFLISCEIESTIYQVMRLESVEMVNDG